MWWKTAKIGDKVVCVSMPSNRSQDHEIFPEVGKVYTIRELVLMCDEDVPYVRLNEIVNKPVDYSDGFNECAFGCMRFRPVEPHKTDISWAHEILRNINEQVPA